MKEVISRHFVELSDSSNQLHRHRQTVLTAPSEDDFDIDSCQSIRPIYVYKQLNHSALVLGSFTRMSQQFND